MITAANIKSMETISANSKSTKRAEDNKSDEKGFQELINKASSSKQQDKQEKPVEKQDSESDKKEMQDVPELKPGEVIPLIDFLVELPAAAETLQAVPQELQIIPGTIPELKPELKPEITPDLVPGTAQTEASTGAVSDMLPEIVTTNPNAEKILMDQNPDILQTAQKETSVKTASANETSTVDHMALKGSTDTVDSLKQHMVNQSKIVQANEKPAVPVKPADPEKPVSLPIADNQPKTDKPNQEILLNKSQITDTTKPVVEEVLPKGNETAKLQTEAPQAAGKTEEREVDLGSVLQQEKTGVSPFKEDIIKVKLAEPFNHLNSENVKNVADKITESIQNGIREFQIQMDPENLGKIQVKIQMLETGIKVILNCESQKTYQLLAERAGGINQIVEQNIGSQTIVEVKEGYWNQQKNATDQHSGQQGQERQRQEQASQDETNDFIQQMRLGFFDKGLVV